MQRNRGAGALLARPDRRPGDRSCRADGALRGPRPVAGRARNLTGIRPNLALDVTLFRLEVELQAQGEAEEEREGSVDPALTRTEIDTRLAVPVQPGLGLVAFPAPESPPEEPPTGRSVQRLLDGLANQAQVVLVIELSEPDVQMAAFEGRRRPVRRLRADPGQHRVRDTPSRAAGGAAEHHPHRMPSAGTPHVPDPEGDHASPGGTSPGRRHPLRAAPVGAGGARVPTRQGYTAQPPMTLSPRSPGQSLAPCTPSRTPLSLRSSPFLIESDPPFRSLVLNCLSAAQTPGRLDSKCRIRLRASRRSSVPGPAQPNAGRRTSPHRPVGDFTNGRPNGSLMASRA